MTRTSSGASEVPHRVWLSIWVMACDAMGPRQIMASSILVSSPTDMAFSPCA